MTSVDRHKQVKQLFDEACDLSIEERRQFLDRRCDGDDSLRQEVESLLAFEDEENAALSTSHRGAGPRLLAEELAGGEPSPDEHPKEIGSYKIRGVLGRGGMGIVYDAQQENPRRRVALKVIRSAFATEELLKRFWHEAQLLGQLDHPGIASIHEAGSAPIGDRTWPFIAMELVDGVPIDRHVRDLGLGTRETLELVARVCDAVEHAHQKGVVHRDLKPGNILVRGEATSTQQSTSSPDSIGEPKVLDFGVARITDSDLQVTTVHTHAGQIVGTLSYMSPEQVAGRRDIDARCDVYSLGILLFELLSGSRPYDLSGKPMAEAARIITDTDPPSLVSRTPAIGSDVSTIVSKALERDPDRRYVSAGELGADLRRYLADEPILARPASTIYQFKKFARRNHVLVGGVAATLLSLTAGLVATTLALVNAQAERDAKAVALEQSNTVTEFLSDMLGAANPSEQGREVTVREVLDQAALDIEGRFENRLVEAELRKVIGYTYTTLSEYAKADTQITAAVALWDELVENRRDPWFFDGYQLIGQVAYFQGDYERALESFTKAYDFVRLEDPPDHMAAIMTGSNVAFLNMQLGHYDVAREIFQQGLEAARQSVGEDDPLAIDVKGNLAMLETRMGRYGEAIALYEDAIERSERVRGPEDPQTILFRSNLGTALLRDHRNEQGREQLSRVYEIQQRVLGPDHSQTMITLGNLARVLGRLGEEREALRLVEEGLTLSMNKYGEENPSTIYLQSTLVKALLGVGETGRALDVARKALKTSRVVLGEDADPVATAWEDYILALTAHGDPEAGLREAQEFTTSATETYGPRHDRVRRGRIRLSEVYEELDRDEDAERELLAAYELSDSLQTKEVAEKLVSIYEQMGRTEDAERWRASTVSR